MAGLGGEVEFTDYMLIKAIVLIVLAFAWGIYCGIKGLELNGRPPAEGQSEAGSRQQPGSQAGQD